MPREKKVKEPKTGCVFCTGKAVPGIFVEPEEPENPNIIIVGEAPGKEEKREGRPFVGASGQILRSSVLLPNDARPVIVNARNCWHEEKPNTEQIKASRERYLNPILKKYPGLPVVSLGEYAAQALLGGGKRKGVGKLANKAFILNEHLTTFSYHPAYYLYEKNARILEHIFISVRAALQQAAKPEYILGVMPDDPTVLREMVVDVEADNLDYPMYGTEGVLFGFLPVGGVARLFTPDQITLDMVAMLNNYVKKVIGHSMIYDLIFLAANGFLFPNASFHDTMTYHNNVAPAEWWATLKFLARKYLKYGFWEADFSTYIRENGRVKGISPEIVNPYNALDLYATEGLYKKQQAPYGPFRMDMDYLKYVRDMTLNGFNVKKQCLVDLGANIKEEAKTLEESARIKFDLGDDFNFNSPAQVKLVMQERGFDKLKKTDKFSLKRTGDEFAEDVLTMRGLNKQEGTYISGFLDKIVPTVNGGLIYSKFGRAETGRLRSSDPNLQNVHPKIRECFCSRFEGGKLVKPDLSALEYRLIAHDSRESKLLDVFNANGDIHAKAYLDVFGRAHQNKDERDLAKTINYAGCYKCGLQKFLDISELTRAVGEPIFKKMQTMYPMVNVLRDNVTAMLRSTGIVTNLFGRVRQFDMPITEDDVREAFNWRIQSSGHDVLEVFAMAAWGYEPIKYWMERGEALLVDEVHDDFTLDCSPAALVDVVPALQNISDHLNEIVEHDLGVKVSVRLFAEIKVLDKWE